MTRNTGNMDQILRITLGLGVLSLAFVGPETPWGFLGVIPLFTGLLGWCPLYSILGVTTCAVSDDSKTS